MKKYTFGSFVENRMQFANNNPMSSIANNISDLIDWTKRKGDRFNQTNLERFQIDYVKPLGLNMDPKLAMDGAERLRLYSKGANSAVDNEKDWNLINSFNQLANDMQKLAKAKPLS